MKPTTSSCPSRPVPETRGAERPRAHRPSGVFDKGQLVGRSSSWSTTAPPTEPARVIRAMMEATRRVQACSTRTPRHGRRLKERRGGARGRLIATIDADLSTSRRPAAAQARALRIFGRRRAGWRSWSVAPRTSATHQPRLQLHAEHRVRHAPRRQQDRLRDLRSEVFQDLLTYEGSTSTASFIMVAAHAKGYSYRRSKNPLRAAQGRPELPRQEGRQASVKAVYDMGKALWSTGRAGRRTLHTSFYAAPWSIARRSATRCGTCMARLHGRLQPDHWMITRRGRALLRHPAQEAHGCRRAPRAQLQDEKLRRPDPARLPERALLPDEDEGSRLRPRTSRPRTICTSCAAQQGGHPLTCASTS